MQCVRPKRNRTAHNNRSLQCALVASIGVCLLLVIVCEARALSFVSRSANMQACGKRCGPCCPAQEKQAQRRRVMRLTQKQQDILDALRGGAVAHYMPYQGRFNPNPHYFLSTTLCRCTREIKRLLALGLAMQTSRSPGRRHIVVAAPIEDRAGQHSTQQAQPATSTQQAGAQ